MSTHFQTAVKLEHITIDIPAVEWENMDVNIRQIIYVKKVQEQVCKLQGNKFALLCMNYVSFHDTLEIARTQGELLTGLTYQILSPPQ